MKHIRRASALLVSAVALVVMSASPAFAHATLQQTSPAPGQVLKGAPQAVMLRFNEPVEVAFGSIRVFNSNGDRLEVGKATHPGGKQSQVRVGLPGLRKDSYVVTWRVISADSHPVSGAFTFQIGQGASTRNLQSLTERLVASQGGDQSVGFVYAVARFVVFASLALLIGGGGFLLFVWPDGRGSRGAARVIWLGWAGAILATAAGLAVDGPYSGALPLADALKPSVVNEVLDTRFGKVWLVRLVLLLLAWPLLRILVNHRPVAEYPLPSWWRPTAAALGAAIVLTPGLGGHSGTGDLVPFALLSDAVHVAAMALWFGGLVVLLAVVLPGADAARLRSVVPRYSRLAFGAVCAVVATGGFQAWRELGDFAALRDTDYGRILAAKLLAFGAIIIAAAFSREIVNRRFAVPEPAPTPTRRAPVMAGGIAPPRAAISGVFGLFDDSTPDEETDLRNLRRHIGTEVLLAVVVLALTALLVNAAPGRAAGNSGASGVTLKSQKLWVDITAVPGGAGRNDLHVTALSPQGTPAELAQSGGLDNVGEMQIELSLPSRGIAPIKAPLRRLGPGHYLAPSFDLPIAGDWRITARGLLTQTDEVALSGKLTVR